MGGFTIRVYGSGESDLYDGDAVYDGGGTGISMTL
jgi:hypothetical protein